MTAPDPVAPDDSSGDAVALPQAGAASRDRIFLRGHVREVEIGAFRQERGVLQRIRLEIVAEVTADAAAVAGDDVDGILSYDTLIHAIDAELAAARVNLLETLAERIAARVLRHGRAARVAVRIEKLDRGPYILGVEIVRGRADAPDRAAEAMPRPRVVLLPAGAQTDAALPALLDRLASEAVPTVLIATPDFEPPAVAEATARRRIALLALEQAAWRLSARDPRCGVVDSRTELDWALRGGGLAVWAPARLILEATDAPEGVTPAEVARWFAGTFDAVELIAPATLAEV